MSSSASTCSSDSSGATLSIHRSTISVSRRTVSSPSYEDDSFEAAPDDSMDVTPDDYFPSFHSSEDSLMVTHYRDRYMRNVARPLEEELDIYWRANCSDSIGSDRHRRSSFRSDVTGHDPAFDISAITVYDDSADYPSERFADDSMEDSSYRRGYEAGICRSLTDEVDSYRGKLYDGRPDRPMQSTFRGDDGGEDADFSVSRISDAGDRWQQYKHIPETTFEDSQGSMDTADYIQKGYDDYMNAASLEPSSSSKETSAAHRSGGGGGSCCCSAKSNETDSLGSPGGNQRGTFDVPAPITGRVTHDASTKSKGSGSCGGNVSQSDDPNVQKMLRKLDAHYADRFVASSPRRETREYRQRMGWAGRPERQEHSSFKRNVTAEEPDFSTSDVEGSGGPFADVLPGYEPTMQDMVEPESYEWPASGYPSDCNLLDSADGPQAPPPALAGTYDLPAPRRHQGTYVIPVKPPGENVTFGSGGGGSSDEEEDPDSTELFLEKLANHYTEKYLQSSPTRETQEYHRRLGMCGAEMQRQSTVAGDGSRRPAAVADFSLSSVEGDGDVYANVLPNYDPTMGEFDDVSIGCGSDYDSGLPSAMFEPRAIKGYSLYAESDGGRETTCGCSSSNANATYEQPARNTNATYEMPARNANTTNEMPARNTNATYEMPARNANATYEQPSRNANATYEMPARNANTTNEMPARNTNATYEMPARNANATYEQPARNANATYEMPARNANTTNEMPARNTNATYEMPARNANATYEQPARNANADSTAASDSFDDSLERPPRSGGSSCCCSGGNDASTYSGPRRPPMQLRSSFRADRSGASPAFNPSPIEGDGDPFAHQMQVSPTLTDMEDDSESNVNGGAAVCENITRVLHRTPLGTKEYADLIEDLAECRQMNNITIDLGARPQRRIARYAGVPGASGLPSGVPGSRPHAPGSRIPAPERSRPRACPATTAARPSRIPVSTSRRPRSTAPAPRPDATFCKARAKSAHPKVTPAPRPPASRYQPNAYRPVPAQRRTGSGGSGGSGSDRPPWRGANAAIASRPPTVRFVPYQPRTRTTAALAQQRSTGGQRSTSEPPPIGTTPRIPRARSNPGAPRKPPRPALFRDAPVDENAWIREEMARTAPGTPEFRQLQEILAEAEGRPASAPPQRASSAAPAAATAEDAIAFIRGAMAQVAHGSVQYAKLLVMLMDCQGWDGNARPTVPPEPDPCDYILQEMKHTDRNSTKYIQLEQMLLECRGQDFAPAAAPAGVCGGGGGGNGGSPSGQGAFRRAKDAYYRMNPSVDGRRPTGPRHFNEQHPPPDIDFDPMLGPPDYSAFFESTLDSTPRSRSPSPSRSPSHSPSPSRSARSGYEPPNRGPPMDERMRFFATTPRQPDRWMNMPPLPEREFRRSAEDVDLSLQNPSCYCEDVKDHPWTRNRSLPFKKDQ